MKYIVDHIAKKMADEEMEFDAKCGSLDIGPRIERGAPGMEEQTCDSLDFQRVHWMLRN
jgi:hypothetical protein